MPPRHEIDMPTALTWLIFITISNSWGDVYKIATHFMILIQTSKRGKYGTRSDLRYTNLLLSSAYYISILTFFVYCKVLIFLSISKRLHTFEGMARGHTLKE